jgi:hypothetical protein
MTISSIGYTGTVTDAEWARLIPLAGGSEYTVPGPDDYNATVASGDRNVDISPGSAAGQGILDENDAHVVINIPSVGSGSRWDMIGLKRDWGAGTTTVVRIAGSSSKVLPSRDHNPGVLDVQPLWLVRVAAGQTTVQEFVDLRAFVGNGGAFALNDLVLSYLDRVGTVLNIGAIRWERRIVASIPQWVRSGPNVWTSRQLMKLAERDMPANIAQPGETSVSGRIYCTVSVTLAVAQPVDITGRVFWNSQYGTAAGTDAIKFDNGTGVTIISDRWHNFGSTGGMFTSQTARVFLPAGTTTFILACNHESGGYPRYIHGARLTVWAVS